LHGPAVERQTERRTALAIFCLCLFAYGYFVYRGAHHNPDSRLALTYSIVEEGTVTIDRYAGRTLDRAYRDGHYYTDKAPGVSLALAPLYALLRPSLASMASIEAEDRFITRYLLTFLGIGIPAAAFSAWLFGWLRRIERGIWARTVVVLGYALGSPAYQFSTAAFGHVPAGMCLFGAFALASRSGSDSTRRSLAAGTGILLGSAITMEYPAAVPAAAIALYAANQTRRFGHLLSLGAGLLPPLAVLALYHWLAFGAPWRIGYASLDPFAGYAAIQGTGLFGVHWPNLHIATELMVGQKRGLFVFAPWLLLALPGAVILWRRGAQRAQVLLAVAVAISLLAVNAGYAAWDGGASWGPRHLVPSLPFLAVLALPAIVCWPSVAALLAGASIALTWAGIASLGLPPPEQAAPLTEALLPRVLSGYVTNNWGQVLGLNSWRALAIPAGGAAVLAAWAVGLRHSFGWLAAGLAALSAAVTVNRDYLEYSEGYYLYLGTRLAGGARLYAETASTQPPVLPALISALWQIQPDVYLPRLLAISCYLAAALLSGRLAAQLTPHRLAGPLATALCAVLPLGASLPRALDPNAVLALLAPALALLWWRAQREPRPAGWGLLAGIVAGAGLSTKLTFLPFVLAPLVPAAHLIVTGSWKRLSTRGRRQAEVGTGGVSSTAPGSVLSHQRWSISFAGDIGRNYHRTRLPGLIAYLAGLGLVIASQVFYWGAVAGWAASDAIFGELESPLLIAGAALAVLQLVQLEGLAILAACAGWWLARRRGCSPDLLVFLPAAAVLPLLAVHQGTFVAVARPAEPFIAAFAALAVVVLAGKCASAWERRWPSQRRAFGPIALLLAASVLVIPVQHTLRARSSASTTPHELVVEAIVRHSGPGEDVLAPPYYAALAGRRMLFDYADWTVWGMRSEAGFSREQDMTQRLVSALEQGHVPAVFADFRLWYVHEVGEALERHYTPVGTDGDIPARSVTVFLPAQRNPLVER
jgi:hypothetical protein